MKILIVDDSSFKRKALAHFIEEKGHEVIEAGDGQEGLEKARAYMPDIIISDLLMPRMDGFQFIRNIKRDEQLSILPIIVYSATYKGGKERELALSLGAIGFIEDVGKSEIFWQELQRIIEGGLCKAGKICKPIIEDDAEFMREYAPIIQAKLEKKIRELEHERDRAQAYLDVAGVIFVVIDSDEKVTLLNKKGSEILGYAEGEIIGENWFDNLVSETIRERVRDTFRKIMRGELEAVEYYVNPVITKHGEERLIAWHNAYIKDESNNIIASLSSGEDITDRQKAEDELRIRNEELLAINRIITTSVSTLDTKEMLDKFLVEVLNIVGLEGGVICMLEPDDTLRLVTQRGASEATIIDLTTNRIKVGECLCGKCAHDQCPLILPDRKAVMEHATREALRGEVINFHAAFPFVSKGRSVGVLCIFTRTDRKPSERSLKLVETLTTQAALAIENAMFNDKIQQNAADLEQKVKERTRQLSTANKELETFSYSISHDLRAPLRAISGFAEIIARRHSSGLNEEGKHYVDNIVLASARMGRLIDELLAYCRLGRTELRLEPVSLRSIFDIVASDLAVRLTETSGTLKIADALPTVMGDSTLLSRMFTNLVENALIYRKPEVPPQVEVTHQIKNGHVIVKVSDNGIGIPSEHYEKIFNIFQRLHSEDEYPGTGVGLAIVKKAAELLGGSVSVESEIGKGSMFLIELQRSDI